MKRVVVDLQAFRHQDTQDLVFKELSLVDLETYESNDYIFKPPRDSGGRSFLGRFLQSRRQGIRSDRWELGIVDYSLLKVILKRLKNTYRCIYAMGEEKCMQLQEAMGGYPVYDLENFGCPPLTSLNREWSSPLTCPHHPDLSYVCARRQVLILADWCKPNMHLIDLTDSNVRLNTFIHWASHYYPGAMARRGFVQIRGPKLGVRCVYCGFENPDIRSGDNPQILHRLKFPGCQTFVTACTSV